MNSVASVTVAGQEAKPELELKNLKDGVIYKTDYEPYQSLLYIKFGDKYITLRDGDVFHKLSFSDITKSPNKGSFYPAPEGTTVTFTNKGETNV